MNMKSITTLLGLGSSSATLLLFLFHHQITAVFGDCLVEGDMMFMEGQSTGHIGLECLNSTSYDATDSVCGPDGTIIESDAVYTCPETNPHCIQCGERGVGAALCLDTTDVPSNCVDDSEVEESGNGGCLVGDIMFMVGDSTGHIGLECINATSYKAQESFCMADGTLQDNMDAQFTCPESSSYCVQCGVAGEIGSALCLESAEVPSDCATANQASAPSPTTPATTEQTSPTTTSSGSIIMSVASMWIMMFAAVGSSGCVLV
jgi:hypothetical protein